MMRCYCDGCGRELPTDSGAGYRLRWDVRERGADDSLTDGDLDDQDDADHIAAMEQLLENDTVLEDEAAIGDAEEPTREFDLCTGCYARFVGNPLGLPRTRPWTFSGN